ncbi:hypothetical protein [Pseudovibrio sp. Tun.PSC04-5.I4]|uniref:hypothetical protein n=1 Tax=Pseudovibrio sp. Tun.PSC04-5.I4 TaxID=1798213 RepID=UPI000881EF86|nr:hypothetical protein [Pseudovibrio sp. Tun.PSC04-5.I4]SDR45354.1 hypothetical protein SAMN04515695_5550 [Pseudovibrio sp. Tun.PSC04-5.I4]
MLRLKFATAACLILVGGCASRHGLDPCTLPISWKPEDADVISERLARSLDWVVEVRDLAKCPNPPEDPNS